MPDGTRKRRFSANQARRRWYAQHRSRRFGRRFGIELPNIHRSPRFSAAASAF